MTNLCLIYLRKKILDAVLFCSLYPKGHPQSGLVIFFKQTGVYSIADTQNS